MGINEPQSSLSLVDKTKDYFRLLVWNWVDFWKVVEANNKYRSDINQAMDAEE